MPNWLLDTNIISDIVRRPHGSAAGALRERGTQCTTSIIVVAELEFGLRERPSVRRAKEIRAVLAGLVIEAWDHPCDHYYAVIRSALEAEGKPIGSNGLLIAAHALALDATLVTANEREFCRVPGLRVENWTV